MEYFGMLKPITTVLIVSKDEDDTDTNEWTGMINTIKTFTKQSYKLQIEIIQKFFKENKEEARTSKEEIRATKEEIKATKEEIRASKEEIAKKFEENKTEMNDRISKLQTKMGIIESQLSEILSVVRDQAK